MSNDRIDDEDGDRQALDAMTDGGLDPRLFYGIVLPDDASMHISIFQHFQVAPIAHRYTLEKISMLPATLFDPIGTLPELLLSRVTGLGAWRVRFVPEKSLPNLTVPQHMPFWILFTADEGAGRAVRSFSERQRYKPLHVSLIEDDHAVSLRDLDFEKLRGHFREVVASNPDTLGSAGAIFDRWTEREPRQSSIARRGHFAFLPNQMTLQANGVALGEALPDWTSSDNAAFVTGLMEEVAAIDGLRDEVVGNDALRFLPPRPDLWLVAPGLMPDFAKHVPMAALPAEERRAAEEFMRRLERQKIYNAEPSAAELTRFQNSVFAQGLAQTRNSETGFFAALVGLRTAGNLAATLRLPPSVNRVSGRVAALAENFRSGARTQPEKIARMFGEIQNQLAEALGPEFLARIEASQFGVKVVGDMPIEWVPVNGLPLILENDVSRITATPGDLMARQLIEHEPLRLAIEDFSEILVVSAFAKDDRLAPLMRTALETVAPAWRDKVRVRFVPVINRKEFLAALASYDGPLMIFDGHGQHGRGSRSSLLIGKEELDIWQLAGQIRVPPIVILSACDTQAIGRSPFSTSNAFLALGARTVLATMMPIGGMAGAMFIARMILRIAQYLPLIPSVYGRVARWSEIIGGMLRMQFLSDAIAPLGKKRSFMSMEQWLEIGPRAQDAAMRGGTGWIPWLGEELEKQGIADEPALRERIQRAIPLSDTIRYAQMGNPETILIGSLRDMSSEVNAIFGGHELELEPVWKDTQLLVPPSGPGTVRPGMMIGGASAGTDEPASVLHLPARPRPAPALRPFKAPAKKPPR